MRLICSRNSASASILAWIDSKIAGSSIPIGPWAILELLYDAKSEALRKRFCFYAGRNDALEVKNWTKN